MYWFPPQLAEPEPSEQPAGGWAPFTCPRCGETMTTERFEPDGHCLRCHWAASDEAAGGTQPPLVNVPPDALRFALDARIAELWQQRAEIMRRELGSPQGDFARVSEQGDAVLSALVDFRESRAAALLTPAIVAIVGAETVVDLVYRECANASASYVVALNWEALCQDWRDQWEAQRDQLIEEQRASFAAGVAASFRSLRQGLLPLGPA